MVSYYVRIRGIKWDNFVGPYFEYGFGDDGCLMQTM